ncbi:uncharacterized protein LOC142243993 [Anomaloglossus baeobatrachus]|uniref:uncharacterized protein LOC142243993 n=1 Tax=Anomaloglossus baeobatrachus TaxID=238106 RepID=UPI003F4F76DE
MEDINVIQVTGQRAELETRDTRGSQTLEITYSEGQKSIHAQKAIKHAKIREDPETLFTDFTSKEKDKRKTNLLFFTDQPLAWHTALCKQYKHTYKNGINKGRQIRIRNQKEDETNSLTINVYNNGIIMVQGTEENLQKFKDRFSQIKLQAQNCKEQQTPAATITSTETSRDRTAAPNTSHPSPETLRDCLSQLERDFIQFKEELQRNLGDRNANDQVMKEINKLRCEYTLALQEIRDEMCELQQENARLRLEITELKTPGRLKQEDAIETQRSEDNMASTDQEGAMVTNTSTDTMASTGQDTEIPNSSNSMNAPENNISEPQTRKTEKRREPATSKISSTDPQLHPRTPPVTSQSFDTILIMDSNGKYLNTLRLFPGKRVKQIRCTTIEQRDFANMAGPSYKLLKTPHGHLLKTLTSSLSRSVLH